MMINFFLLTQTEQILLITSFIYLLMASIIDIKKRIMYDYGTYFFGIIFIILRVFDFFKTGDIGAFRGIYYFSIGTFVISYILFRFGYWGGGDLKLITTLSIGIPFFSTDKQLLFFWNFLINTTFAAIIWTAIWEISLIIKKWRVLIKKDKYYVIITLLILLISINISIFSTNQLVKLISLLLGVIPFVLYVKKLEITLHIIQKKVKDLEEGDWILEDIKLPKNRIVKKTKIGLLTQDIELLQKSKLKSIAIKDGIPFVPSFLIALIMTLLIINPFYQYLGILS